MDTGKVKWFNGNKGFGFIIPDDGGQDVYVHMTELLNAGLRDLIDKAKVGYILKKHRGKMVATELKLLD